MSATAEEAAGASASPHARWVAAGIFLSRISGFFRQSVLAFYFGTSLYADVFNAALRMPNVLQNLLGEGTLSASFIPVYAELLARGRREEAGRVAGAVLALLTAVAGALAIIGIVFAPVLVDVFLWGFEGERRALAITVTRIVFPMTGTLVLSAWALGILNTHRHFFVSYAAPVLWNAAMIATLVFLGGRLTSDRLLIALAWGAFVGGVLQFAIQLPWVITLQRELHVRWGLGLEGVRTVVRNAGPAILGRGVVQVSSWIDLVLGSFLAVGAIAALGYASMLYILPVSLFGISVAAAELPELSRHHAVEGAAAQLHARANAALRQIAFLVVPSVVGYIVLGDYLVAGLFQRGDFGPADTRLVHLVLAGYSIGLLASTGSRMLSSVFFALRDTRTPAKVAVVRVAAAGALGVALMLPLDRVAISPELRLGALGLSIASAAGSWVEWSLLRRSLRERIGRVGTGAGPLARMCIAAVLMAVVVRIGIAALPQLPAIPTAALALLPYGAGYFVVAHLLGIEEAARTLGRFARR
ncbi:MAG TPA: murein biosynthesis integral membrane protein MurJ [Longimicrobiales bacterium]|nr:murein biosynthesis integral membrane protein MurJ [Longimicrobiales bacterium]